MSTKLSVMSATITTVASTLGTGILNMPSAFHNLGYLYGVMGLSFIGFITFFSLYSLSYATKVTENDEESSYSKLAKTFSRKLKFLVDLTLLGSNLSCAVFFTRLFSENASFMIKNRLSLEMDLETLRKCCAVVIVLISMYFSTKKSLSSLGFISKISIGGAIFYTALNLYYGIAIGKPNKEILMTGGDISGGLVKSIFALHCQFSFLSIVNEMEDKSLGSVSIVCVLGSIFGVIIYTMAGYFGYKAVGQDIGGNNMLSIYKDVTHPFMVLVKENTFDKNAYLPQTVVLLFLFIFFGAVVFNAFPAITILQDYFSSKSKPMSRSPIILGLGVFLFSMSLKKDFPDWILGLIGAVFTNPLSFIFPSIFMIYVSPKFSIRSIFSGMLICFSMALMGYSVYGIIFE